MPRRPRSTNFYARALAEEEQHDLERARALKDMDDDIALARTTALGVAARIRPDPRLIFQGLGAIAHLQTVRARVSTGDPDALYTSVEELLHLFDEPAGQEAPAT